MSAPKKAEVGRRPGKDSRGGAMSDFLLKEVETPIGLSKNHPTKQPKRVEVGRSVQR